MPDSANLYLFWPVFDGNELNVFNLDENVENSGNAGFELNRI